MSQAGVSTAPARARRRQVIDFGVDESWEPAPRRRMHGVAPAPVAARARQPLSEGYDDRALRQYDVPGSRQHDVPASRQHDVPALRQYDAPGPRRHEVPASAWTTASAQVGARRTVTIRGRGAERELAFPAHRDGRRPATRAHERHGFKPDRAAMWAVFLGILLVLVAATSSHAAVAARHHAAVARHGLSAQAHRAVGAPTARRAFARPLR